MVKYTTHFTDVKSIESLLEDLRGSSDAPGARYSKR